MNEIGVKVSFKAILKKSRISKPLQNEFIEFIGENPDFESQAQYLFTIRKQSIEQIVLDLLNIPIKEQPHWKQRPKIEQTQLEKPFEYAYNDQNIIPRLLFKSWKQDHGFDSNHPRVGDIHTNIRFKKYTSGNFETRFRWEFLKTRYGKHGWGAQRSLQSILKTTFDNHSSPSNCVLSYLEELDGICDINGQPAKKGDVPNPFTLDSYNSFNLLRLTIGHPYFYYGSSEHKISYAKEDLQVKLTKTEFQECSIIQAQFSSNDSPDFKTIDSLSVTSKIVYFGGNAPAVLINNKLYRLQNSKLPDILVERAISGILIEKHESLAFMKNWFEKLSDIPLLSGLRSFDSGLIGRASKYPWQQLILDLEQSKIVFDQSWPEFTLDLKNRTPDINNLTLIVSKNAENLTRKYEEYPSLNTFGLFIKNLAKNTNSPDTLCIELNRHQISQALDFLEFYPYAKTSDGAAMFSNNKAGFSMQFVEDSSGHSDYLLQGDIHSVKHETSINYQRNKSQIIGLTPSFMVHQGQIVRLSNFITAKFASEAMMGISIDESELNDLYVSTMPILQERGLKIADPAGLLRLSALYNYKLQGNMLIWERDGILMSKLECAMLTEIGKFHYPFGATSDDFWQKLDGTRHSIPRNTAIEAQLLTQIYLDGWIDLGGGDYMMNDENALKFVLDLLPQKKEDGMIVYHGFKNLNKWRVREIVPSINTKIDTKLNWFDVDISIDCDGNNVNIEDIVNLWLDGKKIIKKQDNSGIALIDQSWINKNGPVLYRLLASSQNEQKEAGSLELGLQNIGLLSYLQDISHHSHSDQRWQDLKKNIVTCRKLSDIKKPALVKAELRQYQMAGVSWLCNLRDLGLCGILADDMGLGKTLQALTFLTIDREKNKTGPVLVVAPTSVTYNWAKEIEKFTPHFSFLLYKGAKRHTLLDQIATTDIVILSYNVLQRDLIKLKDTKFSVVILDEAQMIKNFRSKNAQSVNSLKSEFRISLTGTPIENSVLDLWSQFNFLMPGLIGNINKLNSKSISNQKKCWLDLLIRQTKPFVLRRMKKTVSTELPDKIEQILYCVMNSAQRKLYNTTLEYIRHLLRSNIKNNNINNYRVTIFGLMLKLRQICCEPRISNLNLTNPPPSAKLELFLSTLQEIVSEGHRVLVFSQFVKMLNIFREPLVKNKISFLQLDGSVNNRQELVDKFQNNDDYNVFLISLKAGGTGINLTAADYVIHYDPWWNPAVEAQATDRAHRIGQKNQVHVYKLITKNSIEEKIQLLQQKKRKLTEQVISSSPEEMNFLNLDDICEIFDI